MRTFAKTSTTYFGVISNKLVEWRLRILSAPFECVHVAFSFPPSTKYVVSKPSVPWVFLVYGYWAEPRRCFSFIYVERPVWPMGDGLNAGPKDKTDICCLETNEEISSCSRNRNNRNNNTPKVVLRNGHRVRYKICNILFGSPFVFDSKTTRKQTRFNTLFCFEPVFMASNGCLCWQKRESLQVCYLATVRVCFNMFQFLTI